MDFTKPNIKYRPIEVEVENLVKDVQDYSTSNETENINAIAAKLMNHLAIIQSYNNRIEAIDWLINNAKSMSGNLKYSTNDESIIAAIRTIGGTDNFVDLSLFETAIDLVIESFDKMALISLTGAAKQWT